MKTIKTLAGEIGVTKQAVFQKMKKEPLASGLNNLTTRVGGVVYVYPEGEGMIKEQFHNMRRIFAIPPASIDTDDDYLYQQLDRKDRQLEALNLHISVKDKQIEGLLKQIEELNTALATAQSLHASDIQRETMEKSMMNQQNNTKSSKFRRKEKSKNID